MCKNTDFSENKGKFAPFFTCFLSFEQVFISKIDYLFFSGNKDKNFFRKIETLFSDILTSFFKTNLLKFDKYRLLICVSV